MAALDTLTALLTRYDGLPATVRTGIWQNIQEAAAKAEAEMIELEDRMSAKRDWLDTHRDDPRYEKRRATFFDTDVRLHATYGETLERYEKALSGGLMKTGT